MVLTRALLEVRDEVKALRIRLALDIIIHYYSGATELQREREREREGGYHAVCECRTL